VAAVAADLMFGSKIRGTAQQVGADVQFARNPEMLRELARDADLVLLDLDTRWLDAPALIRELKAAAATQGVPVVAFVSHVRTDAMEAARDAGADRVLARSAFVKHLPALLAEGLS
jgi:CheY-like chemotaxis protein